MSFLRALEYDNRALARARNEIAIRSINSLFAVRVGH